MEERHRPANSGKDPDPEQIADLLEVVKLLRTMEEGRRPIPEPRGAEPSFRRRGKIRTPLLDRGVTSICPEPIPVRPVVGESELAGVKGNDPGRRAANERCGRSMGGGERKWLAFGVCAGLGTIMAVGWLSSLWDARASAAQGSQIVVRPPADQEPSFGRHLERFELEAKQVATDFLAARDWRAVGEQINRGMSLRDHLAQHQARHPKVPVSVRELGRLQARYLDDDRLVYMMEFEDSEFRRGKLFFADTGQPQVLWEVFVAHGEEAFDEFAREREPVAAGAPLFRVYAEASDFRLPDFENEIRWRCFRLSHPASETPIFAFVDRSGTAGIQLDSLAESGQRRFAVTLRLRALPSGAVRSAVVEELVAPNWCAAEPPLAATGFES